MLLNRVISVDEWKEIIKASEEFIMTECIVFTNLGRTYHFKNVTDFTPTTTGFSFTYTGVATGVIRKVTFDYTSVAGYSLNEVSSN